MDKWPDGWSMIKGVLLCQRRAKGEKAVGPEKRKARRQGSGMRRKGEREGIYRDPYDECEEPAGDKGEKSDAQ